MNMAVSSLFVSLCLLLTVTVSVSGYRDCFDVLTSEGVRTVHHGQRVCAALQNGETETDRGRWVFFCSNGVISVDNCGSTLRFDTKSGVCNWPRLATCQLEDSVVFPSTNLPTHSSSSTKKPSPPTTTKTPLTTTYRPPSTTQTLTSRRVAKSTQTPTTTSTQTSTTTSIQTSTTTTEKPYKIPYTYPEGPCSPLNCQRPNCFCYGDQPNIPMEDTPQFIMITFDDAVTPQFYQTFYRDLLVDNTYKIFNPSGCPIRGAFYVSHENTDYSKVMKLWQAGNEIASHTVHHILPDGINDGDYTMAASEIDGLRREIFKALGNQTLVDSVTGFRAPYLKVAHNVQFDVLRDYNFLYDTSVTSDEIWTRETPLWPFTLDFLIKSCVNPPCPTQAYPGLWEVIMNSWLGDNGFPCSMIDACTVGSNVFTASQTEWENFYNKNFAYFYKSKVPLPFFTHCSMFLRSPPSYPAFISWLKRLTTEYPDVWIVTPQQVIDWMKYPMTNGQMKAQRWGCQPSK